jgi:MarR family transcriptional regulator, organic hydroperoxide resistance regulator
VSTIKQGGFLIAKIHQLSGRIFSKMLKDHGIEEINPAQGRILFSLWDHDNIPIRELAMRTQLDKSTLTAMLSRLETSGYIERIQSEDDKRICYIRRTEKDRSLQKKYSDVSNTMISLFYDSLSEKEITDFENTLEIILSNLTKLEKQDAR